MNFTTITKVLFLVLVLGYFSFTASAQDEEKKSTYMNPDTIQQGMQGSVNPLADNHIAATGDDLLDESFPSSWPLFGSGVRMRVGGSVKADFIYDFDYVGDRYEFELGSIAVEGSPERDLGGIVTFHSKQSRVNFDFRSQARWKNGKEFPMQVFVEIDWFFDSDAMRYNTRLRLAYGVIGRLLIGRYWTTSGDLSTLPGTIDFSSGDALYGGRTTQIRWQDKINDIFTYAVALEDTYGQIDNIYGYGGAFRPKWPNIAAMIKWKARKGSSIQLGLDVFPMSWIGPDSVPNVNKSGYAVTLMSRIPINLKHYQDALVWGAGYGQGQAHKIIALSWDGKASGVLKTDDLRLAPSWFAYIGYSHYWSKALNSTVSTNWAGTTLDPVQANNTIQKAGSVHANLIWFPYKRVSTGIEYMWGVRENYDGTQGTAQRIQFMAKFLFN